MHFLHVIYTIYIMLLMFLTMTIRNIKSELDLILAFRENYKKRILMKILQWQRLFTRFTNLYSKFWYQMQNNHSYICIFLVNTLRIVVNTVLLDYMKRLFVDFLEWNGNKGIMKRCSIHLKKHKAKINHR